MSNTTITGRALVLAVNLTDAAVLPVDDANANTRKATLAQLRTQVLTLPAIGTAPHVNAAGSTTVANSATLTIATLTYGFLKIVSGMTNSSALVMLNSGFGSAIVFQLGTLYSTTAGMAGKVNIYVSGGATVIQNLSGVSDNFFVIAERLA
jgi:hypothetical protein